MGVQLCVLLLGISAGVADMRAVAAEALLLADPAAPIDQAWTHHVFGNATDYRRVTIDGLPAIRAIGRNSASGLYRQVHFRVAEYPWIEWHWRVARLQQDADIRVKEHEDFGAAIFFIFGQPSLFHRDVPTLAYVWTNDRLPQGAIVDSPHHPGVVRNYIVESGTSRLGHWVRERRNLIKDFRHAFGREPPDTVEVLALFTDNDQTEEPVESYYGAIWAQTN